MTGREHSFGEALLVRNPFGDRTTQFDNASARTEVLRKSHPMDVVIAITERNDVRYFTATPLINGLVVVANHAQVCPSV